MPMGILKLLSALLLSRRWDTCFPTSLKRIHEDDPKKFPDDLYESCCHEKYRTKYRINFIASHLVEKDFGISIALENKRIHETINTGKYLIARIFSP